MDDNRKDVRSELNYVKFKAQCFQNTKVDFGYIRDRSGPGHFSPLYPKVLYNWRKLRTFWAKGPEKSSLLSENPLYLKSTVVESCRGFADFYDDITDNFSAVASDNNNNTSRKLTVNVDLRPDGANLIYGIMHLVCEPYRTPIQCWSNRDSSAYRRVGMASPGHTLIKQR